MNILYKLEKNSFDFKEGKILTIGDIMLDEYWCGEATRISPEAPVPIVLLDHKYYRAGGAANVAINISALGCQVDLMGIIGKDEFGSTIQELLSKPFIINNKLLISQNYSTINKLRIISNNQQLFRIDREKPCDKSLFKKLINKFNDTILYNKNYNAIVLSDYNKGVLQDPQIFIKTANQYNIPIIIDPKNSNVEMFKNATILTPNFKEFQEMVGLSNQRLNKSNDFHPYDNKSQSIIAEKGHNLIEKLNLKALIITQGKNGLTLLTNDYKDQHFNPHCREVFDVTGAGDTVTAIIAACIANNYDLHQAAYLATIASGIVVSKFGTSHVSIKEIITELHQIKFNHSSAAHSCSHHNGSAHNSSNHNGSADKNLNYHGSNFYDQHYTKHNLDLGIISEHKLSIIIKQRKLLGETIVLVNGCFDILHAGHIHYLEKAKTFGDRLIVAVNDDDSIKILKGKNRPINNLNERMQILSGLKAVDWVVPFGNKHEIRPGRLIATLKPDILIKSKEYYNSIEEIPDYEGAAYVLNNGGSIYLLDRPLIKDCNLSSTKLINFIKNGSIIKNESQ